jgi:hypothetical protein
MMLETIKKSNNPLIENAGETTMETTLTYDYYLQFNETYFVSRGNSKKAVTKNNDITVSSTKIRLLGRKFYKGILRTIGEILVVVSILALCKYTGIYDLWIQLAEKLV